MNNKNNKEQGWERDFDKMMIEPDITNSGTNSPKVWIFEGYVAAKKEAKQFISAQIQKAFNDGNNKALEKVGNTTQAYQDGYAKGRVRCLEQHRSEELKEGIEKALVEKIKEIEKAVEFFDPKNKAIPYVKLDKVLEILKEK